jgi:hypothetical protein
MYVNQEPMLPLEESVLKYLAGAASGRICSKAACAALDITLLLRSMLSLGMYVCLFYSIVVCTVPGGVCPAVACASPGRLCSTAACAVPEDGLQQLVGHLECLSTNASTAPRRVCLQELLFAPEVSADCIEPVLHLRVSVYKSSVRHLEVSVFKSMCCTCACLSTRALCCTSHCVSTRVLCCTWTRLPTRVLEEHSLQHF